MRGSVKQRTKGSYELKFDIQRDEKGARQQRSKTVQGSKRKAEEELARILAQVADGTYVDERRQKKGKTTETVVEGPMTVEGLMRRFMAEQRETVGDAWNRRMEMIVRCHIVPALGSIPLTELTAVHVRDWIDAQLSGGGHVRKGRPLGSSHLPGKPLERQSVLHHSRLLRQALEMAIVWDLGITKNPAKAVKLPRPKQIEMVALTEEQVGILEEMVKDTLLHPLVIMAVHTGARRAELVALKWEDVDWEGERIMIRRGVEKDKDRVLVLKEPKTKAGKRSVTLSQVAQNTLRRQRGRQAEQRLAYGPTWKDGGFVFTRDDGTMMDPDRISTLYYRYWEHDSGKGWAAGLPRHRFHDLRHTFASLLLHKGLDIKLISTMLGHASVAITLDRYSHLMPGSGEKIAEAMDDMFGS